MLLRQGTELTDTAESIKIDLEGQRQYMLLQR